MGALMGKVETFRDFFNGVADVCSSIEALHDLAELADVQNPLVLASRPAVLQLRELLDAADQFAGPDRVE